MSVRAKEEFHNGTASVGGTGVNHSPTQRFSRTFYLSVYSGEMLFYSLKSIEERVFPVPLCSALAAGLTAAAVLFGYTRCFLIFHKLVQSAQHLHDHMFDAVIRTAVHFFDVNPIGEPGPSGPSSAGPGDPFNPVLSHSSAPQDESSTGFPKTLG